MTTAATSRVIRGLAQMVFFYDANAAGWRFAPELRCRAVKFQRGPNPGHAQLDYVPLDRAIEPIEDVQSVYPIDTLLRVVMFPGNDNPLLGGDVAGGWTLFEGIVIAQTLRAQADAQREQETVRLIADPMPTLDDRHPHHLAIGRWMRRPTDASEAGEPFIAESPDVAPTFNAGGRPNRDGGDTFSAIMGPGALDEDETVELPGHVFTDDDDTGGRWWSVRDALASIIVFLIYGPRDHFELERHTAIEPDTWRALRDGSDAARWRGLESRCPEVDVQGLGALGAIEAVCQASGFEMALDPVFERGGGEGGRRYQLRLWRRNAGPSTDAKLAKRGQSPSDPEAALRRNEVSKIRALRDVRPTLTDINARGRVVLECRLPLRPFWSPDDVDDSALDDALQLEIGETEDSTYHSRHVVGGAEFDQYSHVGRVWGVDCIGDVTGYGEDVDLYHHDAAGFDFETFLDLRGSNALNEERSMLGITAPIRWARRQRHAMPLRSPAAQRAGREYILEVSEDGGDTWQRIELRFRTLRDALGIQLVDPRCNNLATVNAETLHTDDVPAIGDSWWALIQSHQLAFRLHCAIEADHAARYDALQRASAATTRRRGEYLPLEIEEVWQAPGSWFNTTSGDAWRKVRGWGRVDGDGQLITAVRDLAERRRDAREGARISGVLFAWRLMPGRWRVGDRITAIRGRDLSLASARSPESTDARHPAVVSIEMTLAPEGEQGMRVHLDDEAMTKGGRG